MSRYFDNYWKKEYKSMASRSRRHTKTESLLVNLAESLGSTLGTLAAKADAAQKALAKSDIISGIGREGKKLVGRTKAVAGAAKGRASSKVARTKSAATRTTRALKRKVSRNTRSARAAVRRQIKRVKRGTAAQAGSRARKPSTQAARK